MRGMYEMTNQLRKERCYKKNQGRKSRTTQPTLDFRRIQQLRVQLEELLRSTTESWPEVSGTSFFRRVILDFLGSKTFMEKFCNSPASSDYHHAYPGGLLEHTLSVVTVTIKTVRSLNEAYNNCISEPLAVAGAFLHDVGKIQEYEFTTTGKPTKTQIGKELGHICLGIYMIQDWVSETPYKGNQLKVEDRRFLQSLLHVIVSHHGKLEWGSPVEPKIPEAFIVHYADMIDSQIEPLIHPQ